MLVGELFLWGLLIGFTITAIIGSIVSYPNYERGSLNFQLWAGMDFILAAIWVGIFLYWLTVIDLFSIIETWWEIEL